IPVLLVLTGLLAVGMASSTGQAPAPAQGAQPKLYLLQVSKGQLPTDTGMDDKTKPEIVDNYKELGGGKALKIAFAAGDSFGIRPGQPKNWKQYALIRFDVFNTSKDPVALELVVVHARSTNYQTRVVHPVKLKPGKNEVKIGVDELANVNGSAPDLARV